MALYIFFHNDHHQLTCEVIERTDFNQWIDEHTKDIKPEYWPRFIDHMPSVNEGCYFIVDGQPIMPEPLQVVRTYKLPNVRFW